MFDLNAYLTGHNKRINRALESLLETTDRADRILEAMTYSLMAGGKRIRPVLCLAATEAAGADPAGHGR
jgi:geranylgeranyl diphosphate synthase type II